MANIKITALPLGTPKGTDVIPGVDTLVGVDGITKKYLRSDELKYFLTAQGLTAYSAASVATTGALTVTYANGTLGVGATLTNAGAQVALTIDGVLMTVAARVLVKNQASTFQNGIYTVTTVGTGATNWVLTRATDYDQAAEVIQYGVVPVSQGTINAGLVYQETGAGPFTIGTTPITFTAYSVAVPTGAVLLAPSAAQTITTYGLTIPSLALGSPLPAASGGTGVANAGGSTITLGGALTTSGAFATTFTMTAGTSVTFPTSGTLATTAGTVSSITGTANQVLASASTGAVTLSLPQSIGTTSNVTFGNVTSGASGLAGQFQVFPPTASNGYIAILANNNSAGNFNTNIFTAASVAQNQSLIIPDSASASANFILSSGAGQTIGAGLTLTTPNIGAATATSINFGGSTLSTYTVSTWLPVLAFGGASVGITYSLQQGSYTVIGNQVTFVAAIALSNKGLSTGITSVSVPIPCSASNTRGSYVAALKNTIFTSNVFALFAGGTGPIYIVETVSGGGFTFLTDVNFAGTSEVYITGSYFI